MAVRRYAYRNGKMVELIKAPPLRHPDKWLRLVHEGTAGQRQMEGYRQWEREHGLKGFEHSKKIVERAWARDLPENYGSTKDFKAFVESVNIQPD